MPINERVMSQGSYSIRFAPDAPGDLWDRIQKYGHILITPQQVDPRLFSDADMKSMARYGGPVLEKRQDENGFSIDGAGMVWWLGDEEGKGDIIEAKVSLVGATLTAAITALLPPAIGLGAITEPAVTYTGDHQWETPLEAIRTVVASMGCEFKVNPDGTIDAGPNNSVFTVDIPRVAILRNRLAGGDPNYIGVDVDTMSTHFNARPYATRAIVVIQDHDNVKTLVGAQDRSPATTSYDIRGNLVDRTLMLEVQGTPVEVVTYLTTQMNEHAEVLNMEVGTSFFEIQNGDLRVGDAFFCFDPPAVQDTTAHITFRGDIIFPAKLRLIGASWPLLPGMGVYYRSASLTANVTYYDLSEVIAYEQGTSQKLGVRV